MGENGRMPRRRHFIAGWQRLARAFYQYLARRGYFSEASNFSMNLLMAPAACHSLS